jgi:hypothetical protein
VNLYTGYTTDAVTKYEQIGNNNDSMDMKVTSMDQVRFEAASMKVASSGLLSRIVWQMFTDARLRLRSHWLSAQQSYRTSVRERKHVLPRSVFSLQFTVTSAEMDIDSQMYMLKTSPALKMLLFEDQRSIWMNKIYEESEEYGEFHTLFPRLLEQPDKFFLIF